MVPLFHYFTHSPTELLRVLQMPHEKTQLLLWNKGARASQGSHGLKCRECIPHNLLPSESRDIERAAAQQSDEYRDSSEGMPVSSKLKF